MNDNSDVTIRQLAARLGRVETENERLRDSNAEIRIRAEYAEIHAEERLVEERTARIRAEALAELRREDIAAYRTELGR